MSAHSAHLAALLAIVLAVLKAPLVVVEQAYDTWRLGANLFP